MGVVSTGSDVFHSHVLHRIVITVVSSENYKDKKLELYIILSTKHWEKKLKRIEFWAADINKNNN